MVDKGNLTTRSGLSLIVTVFREGMVILGGMNQRVRDLEEAYVRFTNVMNAAKTVEDENKKALTDIIPTIQVVKWIGLTLGGLIALLIWSLLTGKATVLWR
jgi:hypothetical protein